ncbi:SERPIN domain-containing protein [Heracleum sosnowskyi]|uniref:SERPIN domain-containing protein n=1 Tax=Heracleum sosnowskyi TaxID=360622 RepID=A0AAD8IEE9_9APIA|nr:SERPIN domain-containing protein [Heracleum sosnowskyi]
MEIPSKKRERSTMENSEQTNTCDLSSSFCIQIANHALLEEAEKGSNFVISPVSFQIMLSLVATGATGRTLDQLLLFMESKSIEDLNSLSSHVVELTTRQDNDDKNLAAGPLVTMVNGAWVDQSFGLKPSFKGTLTDVYKAEAKAVDFATRASKVTEEVNKWAQDATEGLIKDLLPSGSLGSDTALVFANALYFKGAWDRKFDSERSTNKDFTLLTGQIIQVPCMTTKRKERHLYREINGYKILKIPYQSGQDMRKFAMFFFLPTEINGLQNMMQNFNSTPGFFNQDFYFGEEDLGDRIWIPKFKFSYEFEASRIIKELGLVLPFMDVGEFTELVHSQHGGKVCVSNIFHKSYIEVNEEGTEAAASTAVRFRRCCGRVKPPGFVADHPFMFMIREETSRIVFFTGAVLNPLLAT